MGLASAWGLHCTLPAWLQSPADPTQKPFRLEQPHTACPNLDFAVTCPSPEMRLWGCGHWAKRWGKDGLKGHLSPSGAIELHTPD